MGVKITKPRDTSFCSVYQSSAQSISSEAVINYDNEKEDYLNNFDLSTDTFTVSQGGIYLIVAGGGMQNLTADNWVQLELFKNGSKIFSPITFSMGTIETRFQALFLVPATTGDTFQMKLWHNEGSALDTVVGEILEYLVIMNLGNSL